MPIPDDDVARVREASDLVEVVGERVGLKRVGRRYVGPCPFHAEKTPSFSVNAEHGLYYCFGCQAKGDVITFLREIDHLDFVEAVERLAARAGIVLGHDDGAAGRQRQRRQRLVEAMERAVEWYHRRLLDTPDAAPARAYLRSRGYDREVVEAFRLGWAPDDWDALARSLGLADDVLRDTGLGFLNRRGRPQDAFRARVMFPIFDPAGSPVAFGGRALPDADGPKYVNSPDTPIYAKRRTLYGLNWAKAAAAETGEIILCEGYTDVIAFFAAGLPRAVATCGTALAEGHLRLLEHFARRVVLAYDADTAGQAAAERFYEWERAHQLDIVVAHLPPGTDPADVARNDPGGLAAAVASARPFLAFRIARVFASTDLRSPEGRARAAETALRVIAEHPSPIVREQYVSQVAVRCDLDPARLHRGLVRLNTPKALAAPLSARIAQRDRLPRTTEEEAVLLAVHHPDEVVDRLHEVLFSDETHRAAFRALQASSSLHDAIGAAPPSASALLQRLAVEEPSADADEVVVTLVRRAATRALGELQAAASRAADPTAFVPAIGWLKLTIEQLAEPATNILAVDQLVPWLVQRGEEEG